MFIHLVFLLGWDGCYFVDGNVYEKLLYKLIDYIKNNCLTFELYERSIALNYNYFEFNLPDRFYKETGILSCSFNVVETRKNTYDIFKLDNISGMELDNLTFYGNIDMLNTFSSILNTAFFTMNIDLVILNDDFNMRKKWDYIKISWMELLDFYCFDYYQVVRVLEDKGVFNHTIRNFSPLNALLSEVISEELKLKFEKLDLGIYTTTLYDLPIEKLFYFYKKVYLIIYTNLENLLFSFNVYYKDYLFDDGKLIETEYLLNEENLYKFIDFLSNSGLKLKFYDPDKKNIPSELCDLLIPFIEE